MTSTPVTASVQAFYTGAAAAGTSAGNDVENSFSDVLRSQKNDGQTAREESTSRPGVEGRSDRISETGSKAEKPNIKTAEEKEVSPEETVKQAEEVAEAAAGAAGQMLAQTAEELNMTEEEVLQLLDELGMTPMDLLNAENLQAVVLQASGESDLSSFVTDEQLFTTWKNLTASLEETINEVAETTGLKAEEVAEIFDSLMQPETAEGNMALADETAVQPQEMLQTDEMPLADTSVKTEEPDRQPAGKTVLTAEETVESTEDGADVMLARSLAGKKSGEETGNNFSDETSQNPFAQNLTAKTTADAMQTVQEVQSYFNPDTEMILNQITDYMKGQVIDGVSELEMQLHPESLGNLHIRLTAKEGVVTAQFTAQNDAVKTALESQMIQLKETFKEQGVTVEAIEVTVESHKFDQNLSQNSGQSAHEERQGGKQKHRRINLNLAMDEESFSEDEKMAAEMMKENGNTVDYTA
ncbi:MAG: flagellar hook-length control protein FliK [Lachnospiraceae bacterium]